VLCARKLGKGKSVTTVHTSDSIKQQDFARLRKGFLFADATFLLIAGGMAMLSELLGHFLNVGPLARAFHKSPYTAGFFEAHGLAVLTAMLLYRAGASEKKRFWHIYAALVHMLLGGANLLFWRIFIYFRAIPLGIITTTAHVVFVIAQGSLFVLARQDRHS
jgi:phosphoglycerol transferase MdoB-like AlkP superfamily enzyme